MNKDVCGYHFIQAFDIATDVKVVPFGKPVPTGTKSVFIWTDRTRAWPCILKNG